MNVIRRRGGASVMAALLAIVAPLAAQDASTNAANAVARLVVEPSRITVETGGLVPLTIKALDARGAEVKDAPIRVTGARDGIGLSYDGVRGLKAGSYTLVVSIVGSATPHVIEVPVTVTWPAITRVALSRDPGRLYVGTTIAHRAVAYHADGTARPGDATEIRWSSSNAAVASVDRFGAVTAHRPGTAIITASAGAIAAAETHTVAANPITRVDIVGDTDRIRTGDVVHLRAEAKRADGSVVADAPITWSYAYTPDDTIAAPGAVGVIDRGLFTAEAPGRYTLMAMAGTALGRRTIEATPRDVRRRIAPVGRGSITHVHTSDLWPWSAKNGRDYALVGTWGGDGWAYVMDITNLGSIVRTDSIRIDARVINDVTVSPDGRYGVLAREGASNRRNGVVILDLADPAHPTIAATFDDDLTGGVHNLFATNDYLYAISGGEKYVIIDVRDIRAPKRVGEYRHPNGAIHDVWVRDGIAYSSQWDAGVVVVDVGNGKWGGTPAKPVLINAYKVTSTATHEIFPYVQPGTGKVYLFLGDEIMSREGRVYEGTSYLNDINGKGGPPQTSAGYTHIVDFTDPMAPKNIAKYHQEEFGAHDIIVEDDILYQAYYDGGVRVVDVSGELVGNLATQGREIAVFKSYDPNGYTANATFVMNAMPWKGHVLFTDFNSGLWAAKLEPKRPLTP
ncbi:MAG TPA: Ig-like domain-containing protein [Gemmatimonadales bacterium]|nr:Ig-like domain-containing protein [Gemmatimonadales bacterium]